jgi:hypothetical protein
MRAFKLDSFEVTLLREVPQFQSCSILTEGEMRTARRWDVEDGTGDNS